VFDSVLWLLTLTAVVLLVPAFAALLGVERRRHVAPAEDSTRRQRLVGAAIFVALGALGVAALLDADPVPATVVAVVLAGSVLAWAPLSSSWAVRGVVMWALLVTGAIGLLGSLVQQMVASSMSWGEVLVTGGVGAVLLLALARGQRYVREGITAQAGLQTGAAGRPPVPVLRPLISLAALLAASGVVVAVTNGGTAPSGRGPQAGVSGTSPETTSGTTSGPTSAPTSGPSAGRTPTIGPSIAGPSAVDAGYGAAIGPSTRNLPVGRPDGSAAPGGDPDGYDGVAVPGSPLAGGVRHQPGTVGGVPAPGRGPTAVAPVGPGTWTPGAGSGGTGAGGGTTSPPAPVTTAPAPAAPTPRPWTPAPAPVEPTKLPGYAKEKPNRPAGAPAPGRGRPERSDPRTATAPAPAVAPSPWVPPPVSVPQYEPWLPQYESRVPRYEPWVPASRPTKLPGYAKEKPNRPAGAASPGHGRTRRP